MEKGSHGPALLLEEGAPIREGREDEGEVEDGLKDAHLHPLLPTLHYALHPLEHFF